MADCQIAHEEARHGLLDRLVDARALTDELFDVVRPEALYDRPIAERHRLVFYVGHLEAFDWNLLSTRAFGLESFQPEFDRLFAFGIDPVGGGLPIDQPSDWPSLTEVRRYRDRVRKELDARLEDRMDPDTLASGQLLHVALEHRLMHAETLAYLLHQLPFDRKVKQAIPPTVASASPPVTARMIAIPEGTATLGLPRGNGQVFGWDNEFVLHEVRVPAFAIDTHPVSNGEFLEFVLKGSYGDRSLWTDPDWEWIQKSGIQHPCFWIRSGDSWLCRTMFEELPLPLNWPVYVSHAEAAAYARWVRKELPTEAQFHRAAYGTPEGVERDFPWGSAPPGPPYGNFDSQRWNPAPVGSFPAGRSAFGVEELVGNGWEWTSTLFAPFPGFQPFDFYRGYSADFFDGQHYVLKGGSARTAACMLRRSFRNWFQPHYPFLYAGFRCVTN